jgi:lysyl-tRNA synthetase class 1
MADPSLRSVRAWPFEEAAKLADRLAATGKKEALFETGYGPSGLPHIGTFGEVARTSWVRRAFAEMTGLPSRLLAFSDDMDGLRKVPDNVPNPEMLRPHLGKQLTRIPDPFGTHGSFGHHNNARLRAFLDQFGFEYDFASSTDYYARGVFDAALLRMLSLHEEVRAVILPTLGAERRATYSPFLPIHPRSGIVMQVPVLECRVEAGTILWADPETGERFETSVTGGHCKAQWKADWAMRWHALGVDYEMSGKDLIDSVKLSSAVCRVLGSEPPVTFTYELFNDELGQKISKSKGNGLTIEQWLDYGPPESLATFMFASPGSAKRLHKGVIPRAVDDWLANAAKLHTARDAANPAWHVHAGHPPPAPPPVSYATLLNLAGIANTDDPARLWAYLRRYHPGLTPEGEPLLDRLVRNACAYWRDFIAPERHFRAATPEEAEAMRGLAAILAERADAFAALAPGPEREAAMQDAVYDAGRRPPFLTEGKDGRPGVGRAWFQALYEVLLGKSDGPRFGGTIAVMGVDEATRLIEEALARS